MEEARAEAFDTIFGSAACLCDEQINRGRGASLTHAGAHPDDPHYVNRTRWLRTSVLGF